jgi:hypothetical protein
MEKQSTYSLCLDIACESYETKFEKAVAKAVDETLSALGNSNKQTIYRHMENRYGIRKEEIPQKIVRFGYAIEETFGSVAKLIEVKIIKNLHSINKDFHYVANKEEFKFIDFMDGFKNYLGAEI